jgi:hypothetical protein
MTSAQITVTVASSIVLVAYVIHAIAFDFDKVLRREYRNGKQEQDTERSTDSSRPRILRRR